MMKRDCTEIKYELIKHTKSFNVHSNATRAKALPTCTQNQLANTNLVEEASLTIYNFYSINNVCAIPKHIVIP